MLFVYLLICVWAWLVWFLAVDIVGCGMPVFCLCVCDCVCFGWGLLRFCWVLSLGARCYVWFVVSGCLVWFTIDFGGLCDCWL